MQRDEDLARGLQQGHRGDLVELVERHHSPLLGYLYRMTGGDRLLAEDLAQETFVRVLRGIASYRYPRPFKPWLYSIATNLARDYYKQADQRHTISMPEDPPPDESAAPEERLIDDMQAQQIALALMNLPAHQREAVVLRYYQELSLAEIAEALTIPVGTVKSRLSLGISRLRELVLERE